MGVGIECSLESHSRGLAVVLQFLERGEGKGFLPGFGGGLAPSRDPSAPTRAAPPAGRAGPLPANRRDPRAGAATWRACVAARRVSPGGAAAGRGGAASPPPSPWRAECRGARTQEREVTVETQARGASWSGPGTGGWTCLPRNPEGAPWRCG